jgi:hypothetical protein
MYGACLTELYTGGGRRLGVGRTQVHRLSYAGNEAARRYLDGVFDRSQAATWLTRYALMAPARAQQRVAFFDKYRYGACVCVCVCLCVHVPAHTSCASLSVCLCVGTCAPRLKRSATSCWWCSSYVINYNLGQDMVGRFMDRHGGPDHAHPAAPPSGSPGSHPAAVPVPMPTSVPVSAAQRRWALFAWLLSTPQVPANLLLT